MKVRRATQQVRAARRQRTRMVRGDKEAADAAAAADDDDDDDDNDDDEVTGADTKLSRSTCSGRMQSTTPKHSIIR